MGAKYLIDTNVVIDYLDNKIHKAGMIFMNGLIDDIPNISVITKIELLRFNAPSTIYETLKAFTEASIIFDLNSVVVDATILICKQHKINFRMLS